MGLTIIQKGHRFISVLSSGLQITLSPKQPSFKFNVVYIWCRVYTILTGNPMQFTKACKICILYVLSTKRLSNVQYIVCCFVIVYFLDYSKFQYYRFKLWFNNPYWNLKFKLQYFKNFYFVNYIAFTSRWRSLIVSILALSFSIS